MGIFAVVGKLLVLEYFCGLSSSSSFSQEYFVGESDVARTLGYAEEEARGPEVSQFASGTIFIDVKEETAAQVLGLF